MSIYTKLFEIQKKNILLTPDAENPFYHNKYVSIENIMSTLKPLLEAQALLVFHTVHDDKVTTHVVDVELTEGTEQKEYEVLSHFPINRELDAQKIGAQVTYGKRYNLTALFALTEEDDDGNMAVGKMDKPIGATTPHATIPTKSNGFKGKFADKAPATRWVNKTEIDQLIADMKSGKVPLAGRSDIITADFRAKGVGVSKEMAAYISDQYIKLVDVPF